MKKRIYIVAMLLFGFTGGAIAQANPECPTNLSIVHENVKVKNYEAAFTPWKMLYTTCPDLNKAIYIYGERILKFKIEKSAGAEKTGFINDLMGLYDASIKYFPKDFTVAGIAIDKALLMNDEKMGSDQEIYDVLHNGFTVDKDNFGNPKALYLYFSLLVDLHKAGAKDLQEVFDTYDNVTEQISVENKKLTDNIEKLLPKEDDGTITAKEKGRLAAYTQNSGIYGSIEGSIDAKLGALADCSNLIPLYEKSFEDKKTDITWLERASSRMYNKECTDDPMFKKVLDAQLALKPTADLYVYLGGLESKAGNKSSALSYFTKAIDLETDKFKKSNLLYKVATDFSRSGSKSNARSYAQKALDANPSNGKAYLLIASLYASSANDCGSTSFEKRAMYWKAADVARQAGRVDPSLASRSARAVESYMSKVPSREMIFSENMAGKTVTFNCWVGGSVKVPSL
ncbi:lipopolysaccharide assembly protein LapB [Cellulophaga sp. Hel_I_12]|uniref:tetratricopeptide repeat protein n=1 Tax=Cellulophaga sp. Hel_I_12 TaxID=1249972 RepID=UPI000646D820|nr:tetratricopeptide repeat protein [Cellulophaga sp. Hel_I_12]